MRIRNAAFLGRVSILLLSDEYPYEIRKRHTLHLHSFFLKSDPFSETLPTSVSVESGSILDLFSVAFCVWLCIRNMNPDPGSLVNSE